MKVIGINSSPRKGGNTETLVQAALDGAKANGAEVERFDLNALSIKGCQACMWCKTNKGCRVDDDITPILKKLDEADAVVIGSPVYFGRPTARLYNLLDRLYAFLGPDFKISLKPGKKAIIVTSQGNPDPNAFKSVGEALSNNLKVFGIETKGTILLANGNSPSAAKGDAALLAQATAAGRGL